MLTAGHPASTTVFEALRSREFARLDALGHVYLDYAGAALASASQITAAAATLGSEVFGNPHSEHEPSRASARAIDSARQRVLRFLDAQESEYVVCFTANTTAAIKLVAESYPFGPRRGLILSADNHNSVNGMREFARAAGAAIRYVPLDPSLRIRDAEATLASAGPGLFAFPAQSNFSGVKHPLSLVSVAHELGHDVLLDIAALAATSRVSLRECPADFAALSFYKLFGYPTGIGALVARRSALARLTRPWFAGGTVAFASLQADTHRLRPLHEGFEDGTPNFLGIATLGAGFDLLDEVGLEDLSVHVHGLTARLLAGLAQCRYPDGEPAVLLHGPRDTIARGGTVAFNLLDRRRHVVPFASIESRARDRRIALRGGCFCNPGASEAAFGFDPARTARCLAALEDAFTVDRFASCLGDGTPVGAVRISIGLASNAADIDRALDLVASFL